MILFPIPCLVSTEKSDTVRPSLRPSRQPDDCQSNKPAAISSAPICDCECCFSNSIQLSSSIVHIDENDSEEDEYLDAEAYTTANSTVDDEDGPPEQPIEPNAASELIHPNLVNSSKNSFNAISSNLYFVRTRDEQFGASFAHNGDERHSELSNHPTQPSSSCKSNSSSLITRTAATTTTVTCSSSANFGQSNFSHSNYSESSQKSNKCHCRLTQASFTAKQRPLSLSSISSSSSSCCSLSRTSLGMCVLLGRYHQKF